jgi:HTH-type transcriptional regulator / antitoxin HigA
MEQTVRTIKLNTERYGKLLSAAVPRVIRNDNDLERLTALLLDLDERAKTTAEERELADLLTLLIEEYERRHDPVPTASPLEVLQFLMDQHGIPARDLWPVIGSKGITSEILSGKRGISLAIAARLGERFHVPAAVFVDWSAAKGATA